ncbi:MAG: hypothetical protein QF425_11540, partial [Dehalococcoidia bacterium]|nr:hypothetical protein [Dehalococcoidia bacterium]
QPVEDQIYQDKSELRDLQLQERSLKREIGDVESQFAPMEREMEDIAFNILEGLVTQYADVDGAGAAAETTLVDAAGNVIVTTDETDPAVAPATADQQ